MNRHIRSLLAALLACFPWLYATARQPDIKRSNDYGVMLTIMGTEYAEGVAYFTLSADDVTEREPDTYYVVNLQTASADMFEYPRGLDANIITKIPYKKADDGELKSDVFYYIKTSDKNKAFRYFAVMRDSLDRITAVYANGQGNGWESAYQVIYDKENRGKINEIRKYIRRKEAEKGMTYRLLDITSYELKDGYVVIETRRRDPKTLDNETPELQQHIRTTLQTTPYSIDNYSYFNIAYDHKVEDLLKSTTKHITLIYDKHFKHGSRIREKKITLAHKPNYKREVNFSYDEEYFMASTRRTIENGKYTERVTHYYNIRDEKSKVVRPVSSDDVNTRYYDENGRAVLEITERESRKRGIDGEWLPWNTRRE